MIRPMYFLRLCLVCFFEILEATKDAEMITDYLNCTGNK